MATIAPYGGNAYWQLKDRRASKKELRTTLEANGYTFKAYLNRDRLADLLVRHQLGYSCYYTCSRSELDTFVADRGLAIKNPQGANRHTLINLLRAADASPTFDKPTHLPAELRTRIYELYMEPFSNIPLVAPTEPPLTRASRLLRTESLPVFYGQCSFQFTYVSGPGDAGPLYLVRPSPKYLLALSPKKIGALRKLSLIIETGCRFRLYMPRSILHIGVDLRLGSHGDRHAIVIEQAQDCFSRKGTWNGAIGDVAVQRVLSAFVKGVMRREGAEKLRLQDLIDLGDQASGLAGAVALGLGESSGS